MNPWKSSAQSAKALLSAALLVACGDGESGNAQAPTTPLDDYALKAAVEVAVDDQGVPHLYAKSDLDVFFASGYEEARHALYELDLTRRATLGTRAEVLGQDELESDQQARTLDFARWGAESIALLRQEFPAEYNLVVAYVAGINRRIAEVDAGEAPLPQGFVDRGFSPAPWTPDDVMALGVRIQFGFSSTLAFDLLGTLAAKIIPSADQVPIYATYGNAHFMTTSPPAAKWHTPLPSKADVSALDPTEMRAMSRALSALHANHGMGEGSNGWLVRGDATESGRPLFANDSHAGFTDPARMMLYHLESRSAGGDFDVIGFSFLGVPGVHVGHNRNVVWGATTAFADATDVWNVEVQGDAVLLGGTKQPIETRSETIRVLQSDGSIKDELLEVRDVPGLGVLLSQALLPVPKLLLGDGELLLGWRGFSPTTELTAFFGFDRAGSLEEWERAVDDQRSGMQNWMAASAKGIRLRVSGEVPDRGPAPRPAASRILDGNDPRTVWTGEILGRSALPALDESRRFIVTANNDPWGHTADNDPTNDAFYYGSYFSPGFRAAQVTEQLTTFIAAGKVTETQMQALQVDSRSLLAMELVPLLVKAVAGIDQDPELAAFVGRPELVAAASELDGWDKIASVDSRPAALSRLFLAFLSRRTLEAPLGALFEGIDDAQAVTIQKLSMMVHTQGVEVVLGGKARVHLVSALSDALAARSDLDAKLGSPATWGDLHAAVFKDFGDGETLLPTPGDDSSINVAQSHCWDGSAIAAKCRSTAGAVYRLIVGFDEDATPRANFSTPMNNAGDTAVWAAGQFRPLSFRRSDVDARRKETRELSVR